MATKSSDLLKGFRNKKTCNYLNGRSDIEGLPDKWLKCLVQLRSFSDFSAAIIFFFLQWNLTSEKEYFKMQILKKFKVYIVQCKIWRFYKFWETEFVGNKVSVRVKCWAVLVSIHKQIIVIFAYKNAPIFLVH